MSTKTETGGSIETENTALEDWRTLLSVGAILSVLGVLAVAFPLVTGVSLSILLGGLLVVGGIVHGAHFVTASNWTGRVWEVALAAVYVVAGLSILANPFVGLATLTLLVIAYFLVDGVVEVVMGLRLRGEANWAWLVVSGVVSIALAALLWAGWPATAAWALGLLVGVGLLTSGGSFVAVAMGGRRAARQAESASGTSSV